MSYENDQVIIKRQGECITRMRKEHEALFVENERLRDKAIRLKMLKERADKEAGYWKRRYGETIDQKRRSNHDNQRKKEAQKKAQSAAGKGWMR